MKDGVKTSEFWLSLIAQLAGAIIPLLVLYGVISQEQGAAWQGVVMAIAAVLVPLIIGWIAKSYADNRTAIKLSQVERERARDELEALRLERMS